MTRVPQPGLLTKFVSASDEYNRRVAHAWDMGAAEYVPVPWGAPALVLGLEPESDSGWAWLEVLTEGRVLLALSDDLDLTPGEFGDLES